MNNNSPLSNGTGQVIACLLGNGSNIIEMLSKLCNNFMCRQLMTCCLVSWDCAPDAPPLVVPLPGQGGGGRRRLRNQSSRIRQARCLWRGLLSSNCSPEPYSGMTSQVSYQPQISAHSLVGTFLVGGFGGPDPGGPGIGLLGGDFS